MCDLQCDVLRSIQNGYSYFEKWRNELYGEFARDVCEFVWFSIGIEDIRGCCRPSVLDTEKTIPGTCMPHPL